MRVIIAGVRSYDNYDNLLEAIKESMFEPITSVICGGAAGVDSLGAKWAKENSIPVDYYLPDWSRYGRSAGPRRNSEMALNGDALIALWDYSSPGTGNMIKQAQEKGLKVFIYDIRGK